MIFSWKKYLARRIGNLMSHTWLRHAVRRMLWLAAQDVTLPRITLPRIPTISIPRFSLPPYLTARKTIDLSFFKELLTKEYRFPRILLPRFSLPPIPFRPLRLPRVHLPQVSFHLPRLRLHPIFFQPVHLPRITLPRIPTISIPRFSLPPYLTARRTIDLSFFKKHLTKEYRFPRIVLLRLSLPSIPFRPLRLPRVQLPQVSFQLPRLSLHPIFFQPVRLPRVRLPYFSLPKFPRISVPRFTLPALPRIPAVRISLPQIPLPRFSLPKIRLTLPKLPRIALPRMRLSVLLLTIAGAFSLCALFLAKKRSYIFSWLKTGISYLTSFSARTDSFLYSLFSSLAKKSTRSRFSLPKLPRISVPRFTLPSLPRLVIPPLPRFSLPKIQYPRIRPLRMPTVRLSLPQFKLPTLPRIEFPVIRFSLPHITLPQLPKLPSRQEAPSLPPRRPFHKKIGQHVSFFKKHYLAESVSLIIIIGTVGVFMSLYATTDTDRNKPIQYQGRLMDNSYIPKGDGTYHLEFRAYSDSAGTTCIWATGTSTPSNNCTTTGTIPLTLTRGLFAALLGDGTSRNPYFQHDFNTANFYLGVRVCTQANTDSTNTGCDAEMTPLKRIGAVPYAYNADELDGLNSSSFLRSDTQTSLTYTATSTLNVLTINSTTTTSGSVFVIAGPSEGTAGVTGSLLRITSNIGSNASGNGAISSSVTATTTAASASSTNMYLSTTNGNASNANTLYGVYNTLTDNIALANTNYGIFTSVVNSGSLITSGTKTIYGSYINVEGTTGTSTTNVYGEYITTTGTLQNDGNSVSQYGLYIANGTSGTNGTSTKYGIYVESLTGADNNYSGIFLGGNIGVGTSTPSSIFTLAHSGITRNSPGVNGAWFAIASSTLVHTGGATTTQAFVSLGTPTYAATGTIEVAEVANLYIAGAPTAGTSTTLATSTALRIAGGTVSTSTRAYGMYVSAPSGGTNNYAGIFMGGNVGIGNVTPSTLLSIGTAGTTQGAIDLQGSTSGTITINTQAAAGTWTLRLPTSAGTSGQYLQTDGNGTTTWATVSGSGQVTLLTASSGSNTANTATEVATATISGLTVKDTLLIYYDLEAADAGVITPHLYNGTALQKVADLNANVNLAAGATQAGTVRIRSTQLNSTRFSAVTMGGGDQNSNTATTSISTTDWTGSWSLALRYDGSIGSPIFRWSWAVFKVAGQ